LDCLAADGRISVIATLGGSSAEINVTKLMLKRHTISGSTLRTRSVEFKSAIADALRAQVWPLIEAGQIKPEIFAVLPLAQAAEAHAILEEGHHIGKVMLSTG